MLKLSFNTRAPKCGASDDNRDYPNPHGDQVIIFISNSGYNYSSLRALQRQFNKSVVRVWMSTNIPPYTMGVIIYHCPNSCQTLLAKQPLKSPPGEQLRS